MPMRAAPAPPRPRSAHASVEPRVRAMVLGGGTIRTMDPERPLASTLTIEGDRIVAVDDPGAQVTHDLKGACVLPGFNDAHVHFPTWAMGLKQVRLEEARSLDEALDRVASA